MDVDWCLSCGRHLNGSATYCSRECLSHDDPSALMPVTQLDVSAPPSEEEEDDDDDQILYHEPKPFTSSSQWVGSGADGIIAWAAGIPSGAAGAPSPNDILFQQPYLRIPTPPPSRNFPAPRSAFRPPKLLLSHKRPIPPMLCVSTPATAYPQPPFPIFTPQQHMVSLSLSQSCDVGSVSRTSLQSGVTESFVATPSSATVAERLPVPQKSSGFNAFATLRSWVTPGIVIPPSKPASKQPFYAKMMQRHQLADKSVVFSIFAKTHRSRTLSPDSSSLPKKMSPAGDEAPFRGAWSPSRGEKEFGDFDVHVRPISFRARRASRMVT